MPPTCHCWLAWEAALGRVGALGIETLVASRLVLETVTSWCFLLTAVHLAEHTFQAFARASARPLLGLLPGTDNCVDSGYSKWHLHHLMLLKMKEFCPLSQVY